MRYLLNYELNTRSVYDDEKQLCCTITITKTMPLCGGERSFASVKVTERRLKCSARLKDTLACMKTPTHYECVALFYLESLSLDPILYC